jgi:PKD repeat protein
MRTNLLIVILWVVFGQASGQHTDGMENTTSCDAAFSANVDPVNPMIFHFQDQSQGQIALWQWSFGDGTSATMQNPVHTYSSGGTYFVCLTISNTDPLNICHDVQCISLTVHEPGACVADYQYTSDPGNGLKIHFEDLSGGNINRWHWDFGDGNVSDDRNPVHTFPYFGKFKVCLTAYNVDSAGVCNDIKCDSVEIVPGSQCHALFHCELDTMNTVPNTFIFNNISTGDPNKYHWTFDDGATYYTRDVLHHFEVPGVYQACLIIKRMENGEIRCADTLCQTIETARYFDIGGHLFTGSYPINNPVSTGDTGVAYLYRYDGKKLVPRDTNYFTKLGYYAFPRILNGSYNVRAALTPGSVHYQDFFPTYFSESLHWKDAGSVDISESNAYLSDVHLLPTTDSLTGEGRITGTIVRAQPKGWFKEIPDGEVLLFSEQLNPLKFTFSDKTGRFELNNLPFGAYYLYVEYPGKYSRFTAVWLDSATPLADSLQLEVFDYDVTGADEISLRSVIIGNLFPNPASEEINLFIGLKRAATLKFQIMTLTGGTVWSGARECGEDQNLVAIPVSNIKAGLYLLVIHANDGSQIAVKKLLKY